MLFTVDLDEHLADVEGITVPSVLSLQSAGIDRASDSEELITQALECAAP